MMQTLSKVPLVEMESQPAPGVLYSEMEALTRHEIGGEPVFMGIVQVTPEAAQSFLMTNHGNRPLSRRYQQYAADILEGNWIFNAQPILFDKNGCMFDGQNRCQAIIKADAAVPVLLVFGLDRKAFHTIDTGKKRTAADALAIRGEEYYVDLAPMLRLIYAWIFSDSATLSEARPTISQTLDTLKQCPDVRISLRQARGIYAMSPHLFSASILAFLHYMIWKTEDSITHAHDVVRMFALGEQLTAEDAIMKLRNYLIDVQRRPDLRVRREHVVCSAVLAYRHHAGADEEYHRWRPGQPLPEFPGSAVEIPVTTTVS